MGFASDQFFNFGTYETDGSSLKRTPDDNPNFIWPKRRVPNVFDAPSKQTHDTQMQRGFIRGIYPTAFGNSKKATGQTGLKKRRLFFQFNPSTIDRSVAMNGTVTNPLLQQASQLLQPVAGTADFSFELVFDRQAEVASGLYSNTAGSLAEGSSAVDINNIKQSDVSDIGVLADLYVLDTIIGQSITKDMTDFLKDYWSYVDTTLKAYNTTTSSASSSGLGGENSAETSLNLANWESTVEKNLGNAAFLAPLPIRIVFSSTFMVEGFVQSSSVQFIKFNKNYVPTLCRVSLSVRALYIGFARANSYLTDSINESIKDVESQRTADAGLARTVKRELENNLYFKYKAYSLSAFQGSGNTFRQQFDNRSEDTLLGRFELEAYVSNSVSSLVSQTSMTWDFSAEISMWVYSSTYTQQAYDDLKYLPKIANKKAKLFMTTNLVYENSSNGQPLNTAEISSKISSSISSSKPFRTMVSFSGSLQETTLPNDAEIHVLIKQTTTGVYNNNEGQGKTSVINTSRASLDPDSVADYQKWKSGGPGRVVLLWGGTSTTSNGPRIS